MGKNWFLPISVLIFALLVGACGPSTPTSPVSLSDPSNQVPVAKPFALKAIVTIWGSPQTAPSGMLRTLHISVYTNQYQANQSNWPTGVSSVNLTADGNSIGSVNVDPNQPYAKATLQWMPPALPNPANEIGTDYTVQASGSGFDPAETHLCVTYPGVTIDYLEIGRAHV